MQSNHFVSNIRRTKYFLHHWRKEKTQQQPNTAIYTTCWCYFVTGCCWMNMRPFEILHIRNIPFDLWIDWFKYCVHLYVVLIIFPWRNLYIAMYNVFHVKSNDFSVLLIGQMCAKAISYSISAESALFFLLQFCQYHVTNI